MTLGIWVLVGLNLAIGVLGQILMKSALATNGINLYRMPLEVIELLFNWRIMLAIICYFINLLLYLVLLSQLELSLIFTLQVSLGIVAITVVGIFLFGDSINKDIVFGIALIISGIYLISQR